MGDFDAAGDIVTGGLIARAAEPYAGQQTGPHGGHADSLCLNCGTALTGEHCHRCGQAAHVHRSIGAIGHEILHGVFHFEGKLWRTLPMLAWRPGDLTRRYVGGERARFVSPMALFLFSIFALFATFSLAGLEPPTDLNSNVARGMGAARTEMQEARDEAAAARAKATPGSADIARLDRDLAQAERTLRVLGKTESGTRSGLNVGKTGWDRFDKGMTKAAANPSLMLYKLQSNSYKYSWLLILLSLPLMWLMFAWKRQYRLYDHAVFVTYSIAFMSLLVIVLTVAGTIGVGVGVLVLAGTVIPVAHIYRQLRGAYQLRRWSAALRTIVLLFGINVIVTLFLAILLGLGLT